MPNTIDRVLKLTSYAPSGKPNISDILLECGTTWADYPYRKDEGSFLRRLPTGMEKVGWLALFYCSEKRRCILLGPAPYALLTETNVLCPGNSFESARNRPFRPLILYNRHFLGVEFWSPWVTYERYVDI